MCGGGDVGVIYSARFQALNEVLPSMSHVAGDDVDCLRRGLLGRAGKGGEEHLVVIQAAALLNSMFLLISADGSVALDLGRVVKKFSPHETAGVIRRCGGLVP